MTEVEGKLPVEGTLTLNTLKCNNVCRPKLHLYDAACPLHGAKSMLQELRGL